jgi:thiamine biosynthesis lipoprotein
MKKFIPYFMLVIVISLFVLVAVRKPAREPFERTFIYFDTFVRVCFYETGENTAELNVSLIESELKRIHERYGYGDSSLPCILARGNEELAMTGEDIALLKKALQLSELTEGAFDITVGSLQQAWGFKGNDPHRPPDTEIAHALQHTGYRYVALNENSLTLKKEIIIDLGGISKGYAVDRAVQMLKKEGVAAGLVDAGGDLRVFGKKPGGHRWVIGIRHPTERGGILGTIEIDSGAVATSGTYERFFIEHDTLYHHLIDPRTGFPAHGCLSVTILAPDAVTADALATGIFVLGPEKGMQLVENLEEVEAVIAFDQGGKLKIITSKGVDLK